MSLCQSCLHQTETMSILERILTPPAPAKSGDSGNDDPEGADHGSTADADAREVHDHDDAEAVDDRYSGLVLNPPPGMAPVRGLRIRRVRLKSFTTLALVFWAFGYAVTMGSLVLLWNVAQQLGLIADIEDLFVSSLGLDTFSVVGAELFRVVAITGALLAALGLVISVLMAVVYNAACTLFGGLAVETGPLRRRNLPVS